MYTQHLGGSPYTSRSNSRRSVSPVRRPRSPIPLTTSSSSSRIPSASSWNSPFNDDHRGRTYKPLKRHFSSDVLTTAKDPINSGDGSLFDLPPHLFARFYNSHDYLEKSKPRPPLTLEITPRRQMLNPYDKSPSPLLSPPITRRSLDRLDTGSPSYHTDSRDRSPYKFNRQTMSRSPTPQRYTYPNFYRKSFSPEREESRYASRKRNESPDHEGPKKDYRSLTSRILNLNVEPDKRRSKSPADFRHVDDVSSSSLVNCNPTEDLDNDEVHEMDYDDIIEPPAITSDRIKGRSDDILEALILAQSTSVGNKCDSELHSADVNNEPKSSLARDSRNEEEFEAGEENEKRTASDLFNSKTQNKESERTSQASAEEQQPLADGCNAKDDSALQTMLDKTVLTNENAFVSEYANRVSYQCSYESEKANKRQVNVEKKADRTVWIAIAIIIVVVAIILFRR